MKKAASQYISWILVLGMVIALSYLLYNWSIEQAKKATEAIEAQADPMACTDLGISVEGICQDFRSIRMNITNTNSMEISGFIIKTIGLYPEDSDYLDTKTVFVNIPTGDLEKISVLKRNTLSQVKITPLVKKGTKNIYCEELSVTKEMSELKYC